MSYSSVERVIELPMDTLMEIFSHLKSRYSTFRLLNRGCNRSKITWDGWDSLVAQGYSVRITNYKISWYKNGYLHRVDGLPAVEHADGSKEWHKNGILYRGGDLPAMEMVSGAKYWCKDGHLHRSGGLPAFVAAEGTKEWWIDGSRYYPDQ